MEYHYRTVNCPHCGKVSEKTRTVDSGVLKGSPLRICRHCGKTYFDSEYHEPALLYYKEDGHPIPIRAGFFAILFTGITALMCYVGLNNRSYLTLLPTVIFGVLAIFADYMFFQHIKRALNKKQYMQDFDRKKIDYLEGRGEKQSEDIQASLKRLSNIEYLDILKQEGVVVPSYFYTRALRQSNNAIDRKQQVETEKIIKESFTVSETKEPPEKSPAEIAFCKECGAKIPKDSVFCLKCGTKIEN